jgi:hypothetical protein
MSEKNLSAMTDAELVAARERIDTDPWLEYRGYLYCEYRDAINREMERRVSA